MTTTNAKSVLEANIAVHSKLASVYEKTEPHFRPENVAFVERKLAAIVRETSAEALLDLGCGTGFMIGIAKRHVRRIVGVDATRAMLDRVDTSGDAEIRLHEHDTGTFEPAAGSFDVVTAYSFLHHLFDVEPTLRTAHRALRAGGKLYVDLDPNWYFWKAIADLDPAGHYDPMVRREIDAVLHKDDEMSEAHGIAPAVFNQAEYGKAFAGGFKEEALRESLARVGFTRVTFHYYWFLGQAYVINQSALAKDARLGAAEAMHDVLERTMPLSRHLFKYLGFVAQK